MELIEKAKPVPFHRINTFEYHIFASINEETVIPEEFKEVGRYKKFYLEVGKLNKICFSGFGDLNYNFEKCSYKFKDKP